MRWTLLTLSLSLLAPAPMPAQSLTVNELKAFYVAHCLACHGSDGSGRSADGKRLSGFDFTDSKKLARQSDAKMVKAIREGVFSGTVMHPFKKQLTPSQALLMVEEVLRQAEKGKVIAPAG